MTKTRGSIKRQVEHRAIDSLIPYARNSRTHSAEQVAQIAASIREFGWTNPVLIDDAGSIIAGHGRVLAARQTGASDVPCIVLDGLTEAQKRALVIADNKLAMNAGWDEDLLSDELAGLFDHIDLALLGFDDGELKALLRTVDEAEMPELDDGDRGPFQQMTFTLHDDQVERVKAAMEAAKGRGPFDGPNENSNGNALARIAETFLAIPA
jgi:ParB-like chromosome segregation protein Spo0J